MDSHSTWQIIAIIFCILGGGYFAGAETAFASANRIRIKNKASAGDMRARKALYILDNFDRALTTVLIGNNIMHIACASLTTLFATRLWGRNAVTLSTVVVTLIVFFASEMIPKSFARSRADSFALVVAGSLRLLMRLLSPLAAFFSMISRAVSSLFRAQRAPSVTEEELYEIMETLPMTKSKEKLIRSAIAFDNFSVLDIMTPRDRIAALDINLPPHEALRVVKSRSYSRFPVYRGSPDNIVGILSVRRFTKNYVNGVCSIAAAMYPPHFVHGDDPIDVILRDMSGKKRHLSIVTDNAGKTLGLITTEDILDKLSGSLLEAEPLSDGNKAGAAI